LRRSESSGSLAMAAQRNAGGCGAMRCGRAVERGCWEGRGGVEEKAVEAEEDDEGVGGGEEKGADGWRGERMRVGCWMKKEGWRGQKRKRSAAWDERREAPKSHAGTHARYWPGTRTKAQVD
jgi:hypothetical protein